MWVWVEARSFRHSRVLCGLCSLVHSIFRSHYDYQEHLVDWSMPVSRAHFLSQLLSLSQRNKIEKVKRERAKGKKNKMKNAGVCV